jgi:hypothetical protein
MACYRLAQRRQSERCRVGSQPVAQCANPRFDDRRRRGEVRLADFHVHDTPTRRFERVRAREHIHDFEGFDFGGAARRNVETGDGAPNYTDRTAAGGARRLL